jgi:hypothetical protein
VNKTKTKKKIKSVADVETFAAKHTQARLLAESIASAALILQRSRTMLSLQPKSIQDRVKALSNEANALQLDAVGVILRDVLE